MAVSFGRPVHPRTGAGGWGPPETSGRRPRRKRWEGPERSELTSSQAESSRRIAASAAEYKKEKPAKNLFLVGLYFLGAGPVKACFQKALPLKSNCNSVAAAVLLLVETRGKAARRAANPPTNPLPQLPHRIIKVSIRERLVGEGEVPPFAF